MCRVKSERPERCYCDTSEARKSRRYNRSAREKYSACASTPPPPIFIQSIEKDSSCTVESVKEDIQALTSIREKLNRFLMIRKENNNGFFPEYDRQLNNVGAGIEYLAVNKYESPTDRDLRFAVLSYESKLLKVKTAAIVAGKTVKEAHNEAASKIEAEFGNEIASVLRPLLIKRNEAYRMALTEVGVQFADPETLKYFSESDSKALSSLKSALRFYPQSWVDASNKKQEEKPFLIIDSTNRAHYQGTVKHLTKDWTAIKVAELTVSRNEPSLVFDDEGTRVAMHEFAHRSEDAVKGLAYYEQFFLRRRTGHHPTDDSSPTPETTSTIYEGTKEIGFKDNFPNHYMGKVYDGKFFEIFSMGMETMFAGTNGGFAGFLGYNADPDYKKFILGVLASSAS